MVQKREDQACREPYFVFAVQESEARWHRGGRLDQCWEALVEALQRKHRRVIEEAVEGVHWSS